MIDPAVLSRAQQAMQRGDHAAALALLAPRLDDTATHEPALALAANAALLGGEIEQAVRFLKRLVLLRPDQQPYARILSQACNRLGSQLRRQQRDAEARAAFEQALQAWPDNRDALFNLAALHADARAHALALPLLERLHRLAPDDAEAAIEYARCLASTGRAEDAATLLARFDAVDATRPDLALRRAETLALSQHAAQTAALIETLPLDAHHAPALADIGALLAQGGDVTAAARVYDRAWHGLARGARSPGLRYRLAAAFSLPAVYRDPADIDAHRARLDRNLAALDAEIDPSFVAALEPKLAQLVWSNFYLAYQGRDDRDWQSRYGRFLHRLAPQFAPHVRPAERVHRHGAGRIGLVSSSFRLCTAGSYFASWVRLLARAGYEVHVFQLGPLFDAFTDSLAAPAAMLHRLTGDLDHTATTIRDAGCDLLIYPEIGMDYRLLPLAALRLAPRQACAWGHPVTSGLPSIDAYFSCAEMEPDDAAAHYSEPLLLLPGLGTDYARPALPPALDRPRLGLPEQALLYLLPHALYKLHPDNDAVMAAIAAGDPDAVLVLFQGEARAAIAPFRTRVADALRAAGADPSRQLLFLPMTSRERFLQINQACDVMVDALHWSGGNTSLDALVCGLPVVTCPGRFMRARQSAAMLRRLGLDELIVDSPERLAAAALGIARDRERRDALSQHIRAGLPALFAIDGLSEALAANVERLFSDPSIARVP